MKHFIAILILMLTVMACGNKSKQTETGIFDDQSVTEQAESDTTSGLVREAVPQSKEESSTSVNSSSSSSKYVHNTGSYDNMRGFDPSSEDDMDDNGMSRYMENNDEEGWD